MPRASRAATGTPIFPSRSLPLSIRGQLARRLTYDERNVAFVSIGLEN